MSKLFSFRYNSSSLPFGPMPWQFQNIMFVPMKTNIRYLPWRWPTGEVLFGRVRLFGDSPVSEARGLRELSLVDSFMESEKRELLV